MKKQTIFTAIFISVISLLHAQSLTLSVSSKTIGSQDELQATYTLNNINTDEQPSPNFSDWNISGTSSSSETSIVNNHTTSSINYIFVLMPKHTGTLIVPGISMNINGKTISCNSVSINVSAKAHLNNNSASASAQQNNALQQMQQMQQQMNAIFGNDDDGSGDYGNANNTVVLRLGESLAEAAKGKIFIRAVPSKTTFYEGEPISVTYELYSSVNLNPQPVRIPTFAGFSVTDATQDANVYSTQFNGKNYNVWPIRKSQLVAIKSGDLALDSAVINCQLQYIDAATNTVRVGIASIKSNPALVHVLPLPTKNRPSDFSGAIGEFTITTSVDKNSLPAQENNNLHLQISGIGSLDNVSLPQINFPENIQSFDSKDSQTIDKSMFPMAVTKSFDIPFIANTQGSAIIPSVRFSYFDTKKNDYTTISSDSIKLAFSAPVTTNNNAEKQIVTDEGNAKYLWIVAGIAAIILIYFLVRERKIKKNKSIKNNADLIQNNNSELNQHAETIATTEFPEVDKEKLLQEKKNKLSEAFAELEHETDNHQFFILAKALLIQYLQDKLDTNSINENELMQQLNNQFPEEANSITSLFARCNKALYLPVVSSIEHDEVLKRIKLLIHSFIYSVNL